MSQIRISNYICENPCLSVASLIFLSLLNPHAIRFPSAESLRMVHLFRFRRRHDEYAWRRRARDVGIFVNALPQQRSESFRPLVAQILMLPPLGPPPPRTKTK